MISNIFIYYPLFPYLGVNLYDKIPNDNDYYTILNAKLNPERLKNILYALDNFSKKYRSWVLGNRGESIVHKKVTNDNQH